MIQPWEGALKEPQALEGQQEASKHQLREEPQQKRALKQQQQAVHSQAPALVHHVYGALVNGALHLTARQALPYRPQHG